MPTEEIVGKKDSEPPWVDDADAFVRLNTHPARLLLALTSTKTEVPQWSGDVVTAQLDVQVTSDVDLDKFG
jgi:hypothetical protein